MRGDDRLEAWEEGKCLLCEPDLAQSMDAHKVISVVDHEHVPVGEDTTDHLVGIPVCYEHLKAIEQFRQGRNVDEVNVDEVGV